VTTLVLLPGLDGTGTLFGPLVEALAGKLRVTVLSYPVDRALGYDALEAIADAGLPAQGPLVLLGESFSGPLAVSIAARHPDRVVGLVLCCSFVRNPRPLLGLLRALLPLVPFGQVPLALMAAVLFGRFDTPSLRAGLARALAPVPGAVLRARLRSVIDVDATGRLDRVTCPVLYLQAGEDLLVPASVSRSLVRRHPSVEVLRLRGPHALLQAMPEACAKVIAVFVGDAEAASAIART
jgi:pimeloyl-ACP methyl ester carboxylesterase